MRRLVGPVEPEVFDNPTGGLVYAHLPEEAYESVFDFGCGCGRVARQLLQQDHRPRRYVGIDLHRGMVDWCRANLAESGFEFHHHDVYNYHYNRKGKADALPFPVADASATLVNAISVFTHLTQQQASFYFAEVARILAPAGFFHASWFLFDKALFPMLPPGMSALYADYVDPTVAVLYDKGWVLETARDNGLVLTDVVPPLIRGHQWILVMRHAEHGDPEIALPEDEAPIGEVAMPEMPANPERIGLASAVKQRLRRS